MTVYIILLLRREQANSEICYYVFKIQLPVCVIIVGGITITIVCISGDKYKDIEI